MVPQNQSSKKTKTPEKWLEGKKKPNNLTLKQQIRDLDGPDNKRSKSPLLFSHDNIFFAAFFKFLCWKKYQLVPQNPPKESTFRTHTNRLAKLFHKCRPL